jgi:putative membrane protein
MLRIFLATTHLLALGIGLGAIFSRARAMNDLSAPGALSRGFKADAWWGIAAGLWIATGLWRALGSIEKSSSYYWGNRIFIAKMILFGLIFAIEIWPMVTLIRWRAAAAKNTLPPADELERTGKRIARLSDVQLVLLLAMVVAATMMARGVGAG